MSEPFHCRPASVRVIGAGLAGCEVAGQLARRGHQVQLLEQKPARRSPAHQLDGPAELVCSNSLRSDQLANAAGLLKAELRLLDSPLMAQTEVARVAAGSALAVDRGQFSAAVAQQLHSLGVTLETARTVEALPDDGVPCVLATGPLTDGGLAAALAELTGQHSLHFYDAIAPIVEADSLDLAVVFAQSRYDKGDPDDYLNVPLDEATYLNFVEALLAAPKVTPHGFEDSACFEGCLPIEVMAARGVEVLAHGPMKPVGLTDPRTGRRPHAVIQLRKEDHAGTARNLVGFQTRLTQPAQRELLRALPGLGALRFQRYGSIHRNTFVDAPRVLADDLSLQRRPQLWLAGQIAGSEGYIEAIGVGALVAASVLARLADRSFVPPPPSTALGGLYRHLRGSGGGSYQPSNITWAMVQSTARGRSKAERRERMAEQALRDLQAWRLEHFAL